MKNIHNDDNDDYDEPEFFTPAQSPVLSRANSQENLIENQVVVEEPPVAKVVEGPPIEVAQEPVELPRRSVRANKGQTTRYQDYVMQHLEATATDVPIKLIVKEGEDIVDIDNAAKVVLPGQGQLINKEMVLRNISVAIWRPWLSSS